MRVSVQPRVSYMILKHFKLPSALISKRLKLQMVGLSFFFFEQKWLSYEGFCATTCLLYDFKAFLSSFSSHF